MERTTKIYTNHISINLVMVQLKKDYVPGMMVKSAFVSFPVVTRVAMDTMSHVSRVCVSRTSSFFPGLSPSPPATTPLPHDSQSCLLALQSAADVARRRTVCSVWLMYTELLPESELANCTM